ncbi:MAG: hypothetical protein FWD67_10395 [Betaproteobacteria bacterium]|nr:hypothetical protein [Betaproteobacteria bacterium]
MGKLGEFYRLLRDGFPVNRPLWPWERDGQLPQGKPSPVPVAWPQLSVVRMDSTYLECVDSGFLRKGFVTVMCLVFLYILGMPSSYIIPDIIQKWHEISLEMILAGSFMILITIPFIFFFILLLRQECFTYTHFPMRFNRNTRMVHAFLDNKKREIVSIPWDKAFFTSSTFTGESSQFIVYAHKLTEDGKMVLATFQLSQQSEDDSEYRFLQWEFVRQYMEGDDKKVAELANMVEEVMGVGGRRETLYESFRQAWAAFAGPHLHLFIIASPLILLTTLGRQIAMWTSKIPRWPEEIEATCQIAPDDPNLRDDKHLAPYGTAKRPDVSRYAGR